MKLNKYISLILIFTFVFSTTGVPVAMHLCKAMNEVTFESCGMCSDSENDNIVKFKRQPCCESKVVAAPNTDQYLTSQLNKVELKISDVITLQLDVDFAENSSEINRFFKSDNSPPKANEPLFITNLSLLI